MDARNCPRCGRVFNYVGRAVCEKCFKKEEEDFTRLKDFIDENPMSNLKELAESTDISPKRILRYIKEGRLQITKGMHGELVCESCGKPIVTGHYCDKCTIDINHTVNDLFSKEQTKENVSKGAKMHTSRKKL